MTTTKATVDDSVDAKAVEGDGGTLSPSGFPYCGGAPVGNENAMQHGLRAGKLPKGCSWIMTLCNQFRRSIEAAVIERRGGISLTDAAAVNSAIRWERHAHLAQRWLRFHCEKMNHDQRLAYSREVARASTERDKCLRALDLDMRDFDGNNQLPMVWAGSIIDTPPSERFDPPPPPPPGPEPPPATPPPPAVDSPDAACDDGERTTGLGPVGPPEPPEPTL